MSEDIAFWKFFSDESLGLVTDTAVYHWNISSDTQAQPQKVFERISNLAVSTLRFPFEHLVGSDSCSSELPNH